MRNGGISKKEAKEWSRGCPVTRKMTQAQFCGERGERHVALAPAPGIFTSEGCPVVW